MTAVRPPHPDELERQIAGLTTYSGGPTETWRAALERSDERGRLERVAELLLEHPLQLEAATEAARAGRRLTLEICDRTGFARRDQGLHGGVGDLTAVTDQGLLRKHGRGC